MVFSSIPFLFYFLPAALLLYLIAPKKLKNTVLLLVSLFFYGWGEPKYVFLMAATILVNYVSGILIEKFERKALSKIAFGFALVFSIGMLGYFKYADFFIENIGRVTGISLPLLNVVLPIGISFYTFQILSYTIDVWYKRVDAQKNLVNLGAYVTLFPQLIAGPIVRYKDVAKELEERTHSFEKISLGIRRFIIGLSKKILIANVIGELCDAFLTTPDKSVAFSWLFVFAYMLQIYFDFSGYSDMAIGLGKILGFEFLENFNYPFISKSVTEFWRRWHMSLGSWFRDYVYIPMGGNRVGRVRLVFNIFTVWLLTGFWHGAEWNFIIWGIYFGILLMIEKFFLIKYINKSNIISRIYLLFLVAVSFAIFSGSSMGEAIELLKGMFAIKPLPVFSQSFFYYLRSYGVILAVAVIGSTPLPKMAVEYLKENKKTEWIVNVGEFVFPVALFIASVAFLADGAFNPFLYFRF